MAPKPADDTRPVNQRGKQYQAEKLTGNRATKGMLPTGAPRFVYEVVWAGVNPDTKKPWDNSWEPASCLVGWEAEMHRVDEAKRRQTTEPQINPVMAPKYSPTFPRR
jgi:hypothetical protein